VGVVASLCALRAQDTIPPPAESPPPSTQPPAPIRGVGSIRNGSPVTQPRIVFRVEPEYSKEAIKASLQGSVLLTIVVSADGTPRDFKILRKLGMGLDENALAAVRKWRFQPGFKDGQPVNVIAQIEVNFRLGNAKWYLGRAEFHLPPGALRPAVEKSAAPHVPDNAVRAIATLTMDVDENGSPANLRIDKSSDDEWAQAVTDALKKWRFTPASKDGQPISVSCTMDFVRGS
jgi:TonB family protein